jgi:UDP:flavonoid glycosyltransferase YjiC (YdhE family)
LKVALTTIGTAGDIVPFAVLAQALVDRGHEVTVHACAFERAGFPEHVRFIAAGGGHTRAGLDHALAAAVAAPDALAQVRACARYFYGHGGAAYHASALGACAGAELVVANVIDHLGQAAAQVIGVPWVALASRPPAHGPQRAREDALLAPIDDELSGLVSAIAGRAIAIRVFRTESPRAHLVGAPRALVDAPADPRVHVTGALLAPARAAPLDAATAAFVAAGPPPVLVSFGSLPGHAGRVAIILDALARTGQRAIVQSLAPVPATPAIRVVPRVAFPAILPHVAGVICHGGAGTVAEIARGGRPMITIPHMADQYYWGPRVAVLGLGPPHLPHFELAPGPLADRLAALAGHAPRAQAVAAQIADEDGPAAAVAILAGLA